MNQPLTTLQEKYINYSEKISYFLDSSSHEELLSFYSNLKMYVQMRDLMVEGSSRHLIFDYIEENDNKYFYNRFKKDINNRIKEFGAEVVYRILILSINK